MYAVLRAVVDAGNLPTACEIHRHAATRRPSLTLGSTYRLLTKLVGAGVLTYHGLGDGMARYGVQETRHSGHLIDVGRRALKERLVVQDLPDAAPTLREAAAARGLPLVADPPL